MSMLNLLSKFWTKARERRTRANRQRLKRQSFVETLEPRVVLAVTANDDIGYLYAEAGVWVDSTRPPHGPASVLDNDIGAANTVELMGEPVDDFGSTFDPKDLEFDLKPDGNVIFRTNPRYFGNIHFSYRVSDGQGNWDTADASIGIDTDDGLLIDLRKATTCTACTCTCEGGATAEDFAAGALNVTAVDLLHYRSSMSQTPTWAFDVDFTTPVQLPLILAAFGAESGGVIASR